MKKIIILAVFLALAISVALVCFSMFKEKDPQEHTTTTTTTTTTIAKGTQSANTLTPQDFDFQYNGVAINDTDDFAEICNQLGINTTNEPEPEDVKLTDGSYVWYDLSWPNADNEDMKIQFLHNRKTNQMYLIRVEIFTDRVKTSRGIAVGDNESVVQTAYGSDAFYDEGSSYVSYLCMVDSATETSEEYICFNIDPVSRKVTNIIISYNSNRAMEELGIVEFGDQ